MLIYKGYAIDLQPNSGHAHIYDRGSRFVTTLNTSAQPAATAFVRKHIKGSHVFPSSGDYIDVCQQCEMT
jgi:hypothetical protein